MNIVKPSRVVTESELVGMAMDVLGNDATYDDVLPCVRESLRNTYKYSAGSVTAPFTWVANKTTYEIGRGVDQCIPQIKNERNEYVTMSWWGLVDDSIVVYPNMCGDGRIIFNARNQRFAPDSFVSSSMPDNSTELWVAGRIELAPPVGTFKAAGQWWSYAGKTYKQYTSNGADAYDIDAAVRAGLTVDDTLLYDTFEGNTRVLHTVLHNVTLWAGQHYTHGLSAGTPVEFGIVISDEESALDIITYFAAMAWCRKQITICNEAERRTMYSQLMLDYRSQVEAIKKMRSVDPVSKKLYKSEFA